MQKTGNLPVQVHGAEFNLVEERGRILRVLLRDHTGADSSWRDLFDKIRKYIPDLLRKENRSTLSAWKLEWGNKSNNFVHVLEV